MSINRINTVSAPRRMEQAVFRTIVEMACEMQHAHLKELFLVDRPAIARLIEARPSKKNELRLSYGVNGSGICRPDFCVDSKDNYFGKPTFIKHADTEHVYIIRSLMVFDPFVNYHQTLYAYVEYDPKTRAKNRASLYEEVCDKSLTLLKLSSDKSINRIVNYNMKEAKKAVAKWRESPSEETYEEAYLAMKCYEDFFQQ